jgi:hypothetical protein
MKKGWTRRTEGDTLVSAAQDISGTHGVQGTGAFENGWPYISFHWKQTVPPIRDVHCGGEGDAIGGETAVVRVHWTTWNPKDFHQHSVLMRRPSHTGESGGKLR